MYLAGGRNSEELEDYVAFDDLDKVDIKKIHGSDTIWIDTGIEEISDGDLDKLNEQLEKIGVTDTQFTETDDGIQIELDCLYFIELNNGESASFNDADLLCYWEGQWVYPEDVEDDIKRGVKEILHK